MSDDLISRSALKKEFDDKCAYECAICKYAKDFAPCKLIDNAPTVPNEYMRGYEAAEREYKKPQGEWVAVDSYSAFGGSEETWLAHGNPIAMYYCSNCKNQAYANDMGEDILSNFCPHCGADMRGEIQK